MTDLDLIASLSDRDVIACTLFGEAQDQGSKGRIAVANVIGNRAKSHKGPWSAALRAVCLQPFQFSCWSPVGGQGNYQSVLAVARHLHRQDLLGPIMRDCVAIADALIAKGLPSLVRNATHYYSPNAMVPKGSVPKWARDVEPVAQIEDHLFYEVA